MPSKNNKPVLVTDNKENKFYSYEMQSPNGASLVKLSFTLRTDVKTELKAFKELLQKAIDEVSADLEAMG